VRDFDLHARFSDLTFLHAAMHAVLDAAGLSALAERLDPWDTIGAVQRFNLDGLLALWHPATSN
jgi:protease-4